MVLLLPLSHSTCPPSWLRSPTPGIRASRSIPRVNCAHGNGSCTPSDDGGSSSTARIRSCQRTPPSALLVCQTYLSWDVLSVMYITDSMGESTFYYVYVLGR